MASVWKHGLVIGKFYPPHRGHQFLIETAAKQCQQLHLILCHRKGESPPGPLRLSWVKELYPKIDARLLLDDDYDPDDSKFWAETTVKFLGLTPDVVFTSESYGPNYCRYLGCDHQMVDQARDTVPVSGTKVRENPLGYWNFIAPPLREFYARRVVILGPESCGKTTLCQMLADKFDTKWVPELGREYTDEKYAKVVKESETKAQTKEEKPDIDFEEAQKSWTSEDFDEIALGQNQKENLASRECNGLLICDTNSLATHVWHERYMKKPRPEVMEIYRNHYRPVLYLLTTPEVEFVQDGLRDGEHLREKMFHMFEKLLQEQGETYRVISGSDYQKRFEQACCEIEKIL